MADGEEPQRRTLCDFVTPRVRGQTPSITVPPVVTNNFELKSALISWCNNISSAAHQWSSQRAPLIFLEVCDMLNINGASTDAIRHHFFPFSLKDKARVWLHSLSLGSITAWDELTRVFLVKFFPQSKMTSLRNQITLFA